MYSVTQVRQSDGLGIAPLVWLGIAGAAALASGWLGQKTGEAREQAFLKTPPAPAAPQTALEMRAWTPADVSEAMVGQWASVYGTPSPDTDWTKLLQYETPSPLNILLVSGLVIGGLWLLK